MQSYLFGAPLPPCRRSSSVTPLYLTEDLLAIAQLQHSAEQDAYAWTLWDL